MKKPMTDEQKARKQAIRKAKQAMLTVEQKQERLAQRRERERHARAEAFAAMVRNDMAADDNQKKQDALTDDTVDKLARTMDELTAGGTQMPDVNNEAAMQEFARALFGRFGIAI